MEHLSSVAIARLVDDTPTEEERLHLEGCPDCAAELAEQRGLSEGLGSLPDLRPPTGDWEVLQARLVSEGLVKGRGRLGSLALATTPGWMKAAAAVVLFLVGGVSGAAFTTRTALPTMAPVATGAYPFMPAATVRTAEEAAEHLRLVERQYMDALVQYRQLAEQEGDGPAPDPESRFAALEYLVQAGRAALRENPGDPFLNGIVASAVAERDVVLRHISEQGGKDWY